MPVRNQSSLSHKTRTKNEKQKNRSSAKFTRKDIERLESVSPRSSRSRRDAEPTSRSRRDTEPTSRSRRDAEPTSRSRRDTEPTSRSRRDTEPTSRSRRDAEPTSRSRRDAEPTSRSRHNAESMSHLTKRSSTTKTTTRSAAVAKTESDIRDTKSQNVGKAPKARQQTSSIAQPDTVRLNKFLADAGIAARRKADDLINAGVVRVNGQVITDLGTKVHLGDLITVSGEPVSYRKHLTYILLNKPKDYITTTDDERGRKTVMDLIPLDQRLYPVGRLDRNTTGALIITNDGDLATRLMHPRYGIDREYVVGLDKRLKIDDARSIAAGVELEDGTTGEAEIILEKDHHECRIILREGKNREVRRIFEHFNYEVERLHRTRYSFVSVSGLARGEYRHLTRDEVRRLRKEVGLTD